jgi:hypothetical protein
MPTEDVTVVAGPPQSAWSMEAADTRWWVTSGKPTGWGAQQAPGWVVFAGPVQSGWETRAVLVEEVA